MAIDDLSAFDAASSASSHKFSPFHSRPKCADATTIRGQVNAVRHSKPTWSAATLRTDDGELIQFTVKAFVSPRDVLTLTGAWAKSDRWGWEMRATACAHTLPESTDGLAKWLEWNAAGIGERKAALLVQKYGADVMEMFVSQPDLIAKTARIPLGSVHDVAKLWTKYAARVRTVAQLAALGIPHAQCDAIERKFGTGALSFVHADPYSLVGQVDGIGWKGADEIAAQVGITGADPRRLRGGLAAFVREEYSNGHTATPVSLAVNRTAELLGAGVDAVRAELPHIRNTVRAGVGHDGRDLLCTPWAARTERAVWDFLARSRDAAPIRPCREGEEQRYAAAYRQCGNLVLDNEQVRAVENALRYRVSILCGSAGTGKSSAARAIIKAFHDRQYPVHLCAPTGKASRRLSEIIGMEAQTIHRLLQWQGKLGAFFHTAEEPLPGGLYVCDEIGMIDSALAYHFFTALPERATVVLIGDPQQLPPVGAGAVLRDILDHDLAPITRLQQCHRQAGALKRNCTALLSGEIARSEEGEPSPWLVHDACDTEEKLMRVIWGLYRDQFPKWGYGVNDWVFLAPKLDGPCGVKRINLVLQCLHQNKLGNLIAKAEPDDWQRRPTFYVGDRVVLTRNTYTLGASGIMNGTLGVVVRAHPLRVDFEGEEVDIDGADHNHLHLAYCLSGHRMQGSQAPCVVSVVPKGCSGFVGRNWIYTATTRAQRTSVLIGDGDTMRRAVQRTDDASRRTLLASMAQSEEYR